MVKRLTLRKLLGYLDDSLEPAKAKEIGQRIADEPWARELIERIRSVTRRRRLGSPQASPAPGEMDANDVAEYLDRVLPSDVWPEVEQQILSSDTSLAETACIHQTLSLGQGQVGEISDAAWERARSIVGLKGPRSRSAQTAPTYVEAENPSYLTQTIPLAVPPAPTSGGLGNRAISLALVFLLAVGLGWGIYKTVAPVSPATDGGELAVVAPSGVGGPRADEFRVPEAKADAVIVESQPPTTPALDVAAEKAKGESPASPPAEKGSPSGAPIRIQMTIPEEPVAAPALPGEDAESERPALASAASAKPGAKPAATPPDRSTPPPPSPNAPSASATAIDESVPLATVAPTTQLLFRRSAGKLERVRPKAFAYFNDELLNPDGFQSKIDLSGRTVLELLEQTKIRLLQPRGVDAAFALEEGLALVESGDRPALILVERDKTRAKVRIPAGAQVAFEAVFDGGPTFDAPTAAVGRSLNVLVVRGQAEVSIGGGVETVLAGSQVACRSDGTMSRPTPSLGQLPGRAKESSTEQRAAHSFAAMIPYGERVGMTLRGELDERNKEVRKLAVRCMGAVEETTGLAAALGAEKSLEARQTALLVARQMLRRQPQLTGPFLTALRQFYPEDDAQLLMGLALGFSPKAAAQTAVYASLIDELDSEQLAVREAAISNLRELTGRDFQYSADATLSRRKTSVGQWRRWLEDQSEATLPPKRTR
jgi:hypothetical protein